MSTRYFLQLRCPAGHETETELLHAEQQSDGTFSGYAGSDSDFCAVCQQQPQVYAVREETGLCQWVLLCDNAATTTRSHPILGDVPICERCDARMRSLQDTLARAR